MLFPSLPPQPMDYFEKMYTRRGYHRIAGVDEAGRGPLAGPVVAAAVVLPRDGIGEKLFDSKKISSKKREHLYETILTEAQGVGIGMIGQEEIDRINILQATLKAMALAIGNLPTPPDFILIDGPHGLRLFIPQKPIRKGDQLCNSIAAASIVAKVTRDRMMLDCHQKYPQYNFAKHKGYGTKEHRRAIEKFGVCELHRKTFRGVKEYL
ncbi:MAG: ribonuclease HII [Deltaproteobacteria bacterium CG_4_8_14_3_um_filter_45_9]|nr:MAG: ribonuclease HII [Deltaproteobacteria bacterium CG03_land_8_20_14_0_80_45_14]PIX22570.1 MAG: ribonuclease HII [Deltaproteobacteria bacterium CG_4_8_14_3_um_filter_45_9]